MYVHAIVGVACVDDDNQVGKKERRRKNKVRNRTAKKRKRKATSEREREKMQNELNRFYALYI
jgi:hypothetical protein